MAVRHEVSRAWRGARWTSGGIGGGTRGRASRHASRRARKPDGPASRAAPLHALRPLALAVVLGVALGAAILQGLAQDDRARFAALQAAVDAD